MRIGAGPHLFLDDDLLEVVEGVKRRPQTPDRLEHPVLDSRTFGCTQPYMSVFRDPSTGRFRIWYNRGPAIWHAESDDGVHWADPRVAWDLPRSYGASLVDDGERAADPTRRFKLANWQATRSREDHPGDDGGMYVGFSPDGSLWTPLQGHPVLPTWPEGYDRPTRHGVGDIIDVYHDSLSRYYGAAVKLHAVPGEGFAPGPRAGKGIRRLVGLSTSTDFVRWTRPRRILVPDELDDGLLEFYGMGGIHVVGPLRIGLARILRDDLSCDPDGPMDGIGYSVLVTSRDGLTWRRSREPFLDRNPRPGSWDHAMAWIGAVVPVDDEMFFYYGGYARGHKVAPTSDRQIGLARMRRDRYLAMAAGDEEGRIVTRPLIVPEGSLSLNARAAQGTVHVRFLDLGGSPLAGSDREGTRPFVGDETSAEVRSAAMLSRLRGMPARLEFRLRRAELYGFAFRHGIVGTFAA